MVFARFLVILLILQSVAYVAVLMHLRGNKRHRLQDAWQRADSAEDRDTYVRTRLARYTDRLSLRLALAIYLVPLGVIGLIIYLTNKT
ncbi:MAG: hypothetical protein OIF47_02450 [Marinibacterium sp.]|nr:hypothetical protein [Marinibacterium sp.]